MNTTTTSTSTTTNPYSYLLWIGYLILAIGGSALYGASLSLHFEHWSFDLGAYWVIISASCSWILLFGTTYLIGYKKISLRWLIQISLETVVYGVTVLIAASLVNLIAKGLHFPSLLMVTPNILLVLFSNILMADHYIREMKTQHFSPPLSLLLWLTLLDGFGIFFLYFFGKMF